MKINISDKPIKDWEKEANFGANRRREDGEKEIKLTPKLLKEMVEEYLYDFFT